VLPLEDYFKQKNPYSDNATWYEDFLFPEVFYIPHTDGHTYFVRPGIRPGSNGLRAWFYNKDLILAAGVPEDKVLPKTWTEWFDIFEKIKAMGKIPIFIPLGGNTAWEWSVWMVWDMGDMFSGNVAEELYGVMTDGTENAQGTISNQKLVRAIIEGKWDLNDPRLWQFSRSAISSSTTSSPAIPPCPIWWPRRPLISSRATLATPGPVSGV